MFKLPAQLTIVYVNECKANLIRAIDDMEDMDILEFDDSEVIRIDTVGLQLLLATVIYMASQNKTLKWISQSSIIKDGIKQLGIKEDILNQYLNA